MRLQPGNRRVEADSFDSVARDGMAPAIITAWNTGESPVGNNQCRKRRFRFILLPPLPTGMP